MKPASNEETSKFGLIWFCQKCQNVFKKIGTPVLVLYTNSTNLHVSTCSTN